MTCVDGITDSVDVSLSDSLTVGGSEGQGSLACCTPWGCKDSGTTQRLNNNNSRDLLYCTENCSML